MLDINSVAVFQPGQTNLLYVTNRFSDYLIGNPANFQTMAVFRNVVIVSFLAYVVVQL